jgi:hypothetical protein
MLQLNPPASTPARVRRLAIPSCCRSPGSAYRPSISPPPQVLHLPLLVSLLFNSFVMFVVVVVIVVVVLVVVMVVVECMAAAFGMGSNQPTLRNMQNMSRVHSLTSVTVACSFGSVAQTASADVSLERQLRGVAVTSRRSGSCCRVRLCCARHWAAAPGATLLYMQSMAHHTPCRSAPLKFSVLHLQVLKSAAVIAVLLVRTEKQALPSTLPSPSCCACLRWWRSVNKCAQLMPHYV